METPSEHWRQFFEETKDSPPRKYVVDALRHVTNFGSALDLGAGALRDTKLLLERFNHVDAVDSALDIERFARKIASNKLSTFVSSFEDFSFRTGAYDLVNAQYALPFADPDSFERIIKSVKDALRSGGIFVGTFFGIKDSWNRPGAKARVFHTKEQVERLFDGFEIISLLEEEEDVKKGPYDKHWHVFHMTARRP